MYKLEALKNLPPIIRDSKRFFPVSGKKVPLIDAWGQSENQMPLAEALKKAKYIGFSTVGLIEFLFGDFDHVLDAVTGNFVNQAAEACYNSIRSRFPNIYFEKSISGTGLHFFLIPTAGKFPKITGNDNCGRWYFDDESFLEVFYATGGRYCLVTGNLFGEYTAAPIVPEGAEVDAFVEELLPKINVKPTEGNVFDAEIVEGNVFDAEGADTDVTRGGGSDFDKIRAVEALKFISPDCDYNTWIRVGMALKNDGFDVETWDAWSRPSYKYKGGECYTKWKSFSDCGNLHIGTIFELAKAGGYSDAALRRSLGTPAREAKDWFEGDLSDYDNALRLAKFGENQMRYVTDADQFATYDKGIWRLDTDKALLPIVLQFVSSLQPYIDRQNEKVAETQAAIDAAGQKVPEALKTQLAADQKKLSHFKAVGNKFKNRKDISNAVALLKGVDSIIIRQADLDTHKNLLCAANGVVDLETGKRYPCDAKLLITQQAGAAYRPNFYCALVDEFFAQIQPEELQRAALLRFLGYGITGYCSEEKALFIDGTGGNGKGTLTKLIMAAVGDYACVFPIEGILHNKTAQDANAATPAFNVLANARLAISEEIPARAKLNAAKFKQLTGGDRIYTRRLHQEASYIDPKFSMLLSGNNLPEIGDARDIGLLRRILRIPFTQDFTAKPDVTLKARLSTQDALSGMLTRLVEQAVAWHKDGLIITAEMTQAARDYVTAQDYIREFISEKCVFVEDSIPRKEFLTALREEYPVETRGASDRALTEMIEKQDGISYRRGTGGGYAFYGVGWQV